MSLNLPEKPYRDDDDNVLKRRLLGAAVLIALAVIILPLLLDGSGSESRFRRVEQLRQEPPRVIESGSKVTIPDKSEIPRPQVPAALPDATSQVDIKVDNKAESQPDTQPDTLPDTQAAGQAGEQAAGAAALPSVSTDTTPNETAPAKDPLPKAAAVESPVPASDQVVESVAWVIQAGSYADETNAQNLRDRLRSEGYPAFTTKAVNGGNAVFRVKVGPINNRREAGTVQKQVEKLIGQSTLVRQYP